MKALIVDDDPDILEVVSLCFEIRWPDATVLKAQDGASGIEMFQKQGADIVILDLGLPDMDGLEVCRKLRESSNVLIIILTVRDQPKDIVRGLETGADDYITKPFNQLEFLARVQAVLRRGQVATGQQETVLNNGDLVIDFAQREVKLSGQLVKLTPTEYNLLYHLASNPGRLMTHQDLLVKIWGQEYADATEYLKVHIQHLRRKLGDDSTVPRIIGTERGLGYRLIAKTSSTKTPDELPS